MNNSTPIALKVNESFSKDVGRGIARVDPDILQQIGIQVGDILKIEGKRASVAKAMPTYPDMRGKGIIQIDGLLRHNAHAGIDEKVQITPVQSSAAKKVFLIPLSFPTYGRTLNSHLGSIIEGLPMVAGDKIRAFLFGTSAQEFIVNRTIPDNPVIINSHTRIEIVAEDKAEKVRERISYEDIGGLYKEIRQIREMIELPLKYPSIFSRLGIDPPKGVLLIGAPGTGKTLIARAVANETEAYFTAINGPEIIHKFYGESEAQLRNVFQAAQKNAPSIIFLDEIDAIAPKREKVIGEVEKRVVAQLLSLMDGLKSRGQVVVIGATNIPNVLDPALRRPGRFDREISIGIPDQKGRKEILEIHTRGMPLADDINLSHLANVTHGFSGADLESICREAAMSCLRKFLPEIDFNRDYIPYDELKKFKVSQADFLVSLKEIEPSMIREIFVEIPNIYWKDIGGLEDVKHKLIEYIEYPLKYPELFSKSAIYPPKGILLYGKPGTGKTLLAKAIATESDANFISVKGLEILSKWIGETEHGIREIFKKARQSSPCIIFLDEIDALAPLRSTTVQESGVMERALSQLLTEIDGIEELRGVILLGATNRIDMIDPALLRPGRLEVHLKLPVPDMNTRRAIIDVHLRKKPIDSNISKNWLAQETKGLVGADIEFIIRGAALHAINEFVQSSAQESTKFKLTKKHFLLSMKEFLNRDKAL